MSEGQVPTVYRPKPIRPDRLRPLERPFSWIPFRLLSSGLLAQLRRPSKLLYFFLCLVADRQGMSYYGERRIVGLLELTVQELEGARAELVAYDLLAFDGRVYQLLSWPAQPAVSMAPAADLVAAPTPPAAAPPPTRPAPINEPPQPLGAILRKLTEQR